jgi:hypothetical protein
MLGIQMAHSYVERIQDFERQLNNLLAATRIKYSEWPPSDTSPLKTSAGIYHFFEENDGAISSIYVGKAGFGSGEWNLYQRLKQHFQPSQKNALLGKASKALSRTPDEIKLMFSDGNVYLQWLPIFAKTQGSTGNVESELIWSECFCKAILKPIYTDA